MDINLTNVQAESIEVNASITAVLNKYYIATATATFTDPTPAQGKGFVVYVRNGTSTIGGTAYASGSYVLRYYHSGAWSNKNLDPSTITASSIDLGNVDNTSDANKPVSTATQTALNLKSNLASPTFTGTVTTPAINVSSETASRVAIIDASKNVKSADTTTYPSLTELAYVKGVTSAIQTQLNAKQNLLYRSITVIPSATLTGTTTETQLLQITIPANTLSASEILSILPSFVRNSGGVNTVVIRVKMSTSATMPLSTTGQIATVIMGTTGQSVYMRRRMTIYNGNIIGIQNVSNQVTDEASLNLPQTSAAFDPSVTNYLYISATLTNSADSVYLLNNEIYN